MKLIFVSGGVISGLGKGITASSIGRLLESRGIRVSAIKVDPYLNIDAGTMNPYEHGEVYVLDDGGEVDLDLGNYERFMDLHLTRDHNITTGKVYRSVIENERRGEYLGKTVQIIPHITDEIKRRITSVARNSGADVVIVELGGTVGDMESMPFLEAARQLGRDLGRGENVLFVHTTLVPIMGSVGEEKTKPTQHSIRELMSMGIRPDIIVGRCSEPLRPAARSKIAMFCDVPEEAVISTPDARSTYEVPLNLERQRVTDYIIDRMRLRPLTSRRDMSFWEDFVERVVDPELEVEIALVGKYTALADSYLSHLEAFTHAGAARRCRVKVRFVDSDDELAPGTLGKLVAIIDVHKDYDILEYPVLENPGRGDEHLFNPGINEYADAADWLSEQGLAHCWMCNKVFKRWVFDNVRFPFGRIYEDMLVMVNIIKKRPFMATTDKGMYIYHWNCGSITAKEREKGLHTLIETQIEVVRSLGIDTRCKRWHRLYMDMFTIQMQAYRSSERILLQSQRVSLRCYRSPKEFVKILMLNILGLKTVCRLFNLIHNS